MNKKEMVSVVLEQAKFVKKNEVIERITKSIKKECLERVYNSYLRDKEHYKFYVGLLTSY